MMATKKHRMHKMPQEMNLRIAFESQSFLCFLRLFVATSNFAKP